MKSFWVVAGFLPLPYPGAAQRKGGQARLDSLPAADLRHARRTVQAAWEVRDFIAARAQRERVFQNRTTISAATCAFVREDFPCECRGEIPVEEKGAVAMCFVSSRAFSS